MFGFMKKHIFIFAASTILAACNINEPEAQISGNDILYARIEQDTKTSLDAENNIRWSGEDQVTAFMKTSNGQKYQIISSYAGLTHAEFEYIGTESNDHLSGGMEWEHNVVYYPYSEDVKAVKKGTVYALNVTLQETQVYARESFGNGAFPMVAVSETNDLIFRNICGGIKFQFKGTQKVASIKFEGKNGEKVAGDAEVTAYSDEQKPSITMSNEGLTSITLDCGNGIQLSEDTVTEFIISLPPVSFEKGFTVTVTTTDSQICLFETDKVNTVPRSSLLVMPELTLETASTEPEPEPEPAESYYVEIAENLSDWSGDYLITYTTSSTITVLDSFGDSRGLSETDLISHLTSEGIHSDYGDPYKAVVSKVGEGYSVYLTNVGYLGLESSSNSLSKSSSAPSASDTKYLWTFSYKDGGSVWMQTIAHEGRRLQWNASSKIFRCYTGSQKEITLYRRGTSTGGTTPSPDPDPEPDPNPDPEPDPDQPGDIPTPVPGQSGKYGWYELPVIDYSSSGSYLIDNNDKNLYYAHHMCAGNEKGPGGKTARNYTVCYSAEHHCPVWVAAPRHKMYQSGASRTDAYGKDPAIPSNIQYNSKSTGGGCNKGHMLGSAERLSSTATNKQVFYYTNIAPQYSDTFNTGGGGWNTLEDWVDGQVCSDTLYVVIGAYFETYTDKRGNTDSPTTISFGGRSDVTRPSMFYYVLLRTKNGSSGKALKDCTASEIKCAAFVRSHKTPKKTAVSSMDMMSVSDLEKLTGFTYFPNVPQAPKSTYNASDWGL